MTEINNTGYKISKHLVFLERGADELLLVNTYECKPLLISRGRECVKKLLQAMEGLNRAAASEKFPNDIALFDLFTEHHILIPADKQECDERQDFFPDGQLQPQGISLYLLLAQSCNMACTYCLNGAKTYKKEKIIQMDEKVAFHAVEYFVKQLVSGGQIEVCLFGGEPLLNWELGKKVFQYCEEKLKPQYPDKHIVYAITSNLSILPDDFIDVAKKYSVSVLCDIDGPATLHNQTRPLINGGPSYEQIAGHVKKLIAAGIRVSLRTTVTSVNVGHISEIAKHHKALKGAGCAFVPVNPVNSDEQLLPDDLLPDMGVMLRGITAAYKAGIWDKTKLLPFSIYASKLIPGNRSVLGCGAPYGNTPVVTAESDVYPCIYLVGIEKYNLGNLMDGTYPKLEVLRSMAEDYQVEHRVDCKNCNWRYACGGGCLVGPLTIKGREDATPAVKQYGEDINCRYTKEILEEILWQMALETKEKVRKNEMSPVSDKGTRMNFC